MSKTFRTQGSGAQQTLHEIEDEKIPVYDTTADAEADLANLAEEQIVATKDAGGDEQTLMEYVDGRLETTEVNVSVSISGLTCKARKSGNTVTVVFIPAGSDVTIPYAATTTIGTLPEGYRPARLEEFTIGARVVSSTENVAVYPPRVAFGTDGAITVRAWNPSADIVLNSPYNTFTFLVDGTNSHGMTVNTLKDAKDYTDAKIYEKTAGTIKVTDCDTMDVPGTYNYDPNTANTPDNFYGVLVVYGSSPDKTPSTNRRWIMQVATNTRGEVYRRQRNQPQAGGTWSAWEEMDALIYNIIVAQPSSQINGYLSQIKYFLNNADWSRVHNATQSRSEFVGSMELQGYWYGTYHLSNMGSNYKIMNGTIYAEGIPVRFSAWYDPNWTSGWRVSISYNYTFVDIRGQQYISNLNEQLSTALNLLAPQTWEVQHCECNIEVLGYFYALCTFDSRGGYSSVYGTLVSSDANINGQSFTAEFDTVRNYWSCHNIILTMSGSAAIDGNSNVYLGTIMGGISNCEIISVRCTSHDMPIIPAKNSAGLWYARATNWDGTPATFGTVVTLEIKFRLL